MSPDNDYVLRTVEERAVRFVRLWFVDVLGLLKSVAIPASELGVALEDGIDLDGSSLDGPERGLERDVVAHPDPRTFQILPWRPEPAVARMFCDIRTPEGRASPGDSRQALKRVLATAADLGVAFHVGAEVEFFLFDAATADGSGAPPAPLDDGTYFDLTPLDSGSDFRRRAIGHLEAIGIPVKASHHEAAPSQHEIDLEHADPLSTADAVTTFRLAVKEVAREAGVHASFMPKPLHGEFGSGLHLHLSAFAPIGEGDLFDDDGEEPLSGLGRSFLAGVLAHARELTAMTNQWTNSYKRMVPGFEAPEAASWTRSGRSALVRVPARPRGRDVPVRIELRSPDPGCNPYLVLALVLAAGLRGIERDYQLPPEDDAHAAPALPSDLREAVDAFEASELVRDVLGDRLCDAFLRNKRAELHAQRHEVTELERRALLRLL